jgi:hypothetical protein
MVGSYLVGTYKWTWVFNHKDLIYWIERTWDAFKAQGEWDYKTGI